MSLSMTTVDDLVGKLREVRAAIAARPRLRARHGDSPRSIRRGPYEALMYIDRCFNLELPRDCLDIMSENDLCNVLFDMAHVPKELAMQRVCQTTFELEAAYVVDIDVSTCGGLIDWSSS